MYKLLGSDIEIYEFEDFTHEYNEIAKFWGDKMPMMAMEECGEMIQSISEFERDASDEHRENLEKEMADVLISIGALAYHYGIDIIGIMEDIKEKTEKKY